MNLRTISIAFVVIAIFFGLRFVSTTIHYGCHREPLTNVDGGDDCPPPFWAVAQIGFYMTGGSFNPLWNRDTTTVRSVNWSIEKANPEIVSEDDHRFYEQKIAADITTYDGKTKRYDLGTARGCTGTKTSELENRTIVIGKVDCYFALSGTKFAAFKHGEGFRIERYDESAMDGGITTTVLVEL
jgi:hypothetical protein